LLLVVPSCLLMLIRHILDEWGILSYCRAIESIAIRLKIGSTLLIVPVLPVWNDTSCIIWSKWFLIPECAILISLLQL
jgi:hypothetical protein